MGVATGCGCKEVYRFPHTTYPYSSCICYFFAAASLLFVHLKKKFFVLYKIRISSYIYSWPAVHVCEGKLARLSAILYIYFFRKDLLAIVSH